MTDYQIIPSCALIILALEKNNGNENRTEIHKDIKNLAALLDKEGISSGINFKLLGNNSPSISTAMLALRSCGYLDARLITLEGCSEVKYSLKTKNSSENIWTRFDIPLELQKKTEEVVTAYFNNKK
jgi:hypothetical protein